MITEYFTSSRVVFDYLWPARLLPQLIVIFLSFSFVVWLMALIKQCFKIRAHHQEVLCLEDVGKLQRQSVSSSDISEETAARNIFSVFVKVKEVPEASPVVRHLKAIYLAGLTQGRLEINSLVTHTLKEMFSGGQVLKGVLSIFIVIGLLGTLLGLADTFTSLNPDPQTLGHLNRGVNHMLSELLLNMKSAFAPSILGVFLTIVGVFVYIGIYQHKLCRPLMSDLERCTLTIWIPTLYPTTTERIRDITRENLKVVATVADFADKAQKNIEDFKEETEKAAVSITLLSAAVAQIGNAAQVIDSGLTKQLGGFSKNINKLTSFQSELTSLYKTLLDDSKVFREHVSKTFSEQNTWFPELIKSLKSYEDSYLRRQDELDNNLKQLISEGTGGFQSLSRENLETIKLLRAATESKLGEIHDSLGSSLHEFGKTLTGFIVPIEGAAERMSATFKSLANTVEDIINKFNDSVTAPIQGHNLEESSEMKGLLHHLKVAWEELNEILKKNIRLEEKPMKPIIREKEAVPSMEGVRKEGVPKSQSIRSSTEVTEAMVMREDIQKLVKISERQSHILERYLSKEEERKERSIWSFTKKLLKTKIWTL